MLVPPAASLLSLPLPVLADDDATAVDGAPAFWAAAAAALGDEVEMAVVGTGEVDGNIGDGEEEVAVS